VRADERHRVLVHAQRVGIADPAGQDERVVVVSGRVSDLAVDPELVGLVVIVEALDLAWPSATLPSERP
jgi:hypothetical protein